MAGCLFSSKRPGQAREKRRKALLEDEKWLIFLDGKKGGYNVSEKVCDICGINNQCVE
jgi:hypothetical protein